VDAVLEVLRKAAGEARPATDADAVAGVPARYVAAPSSTVDSSEVLRLAAANDLTVVARGAGTKQDWAAPPDRVDLVLDTTRLAGVVEHAAGDLVVVVRAGTPLDELAAALAPAGQQLALDAPLPGATVGGTVATATSGPRRLLYGTVRDLLIGVTVVRADGGIARAGGKVVKNVAGYDLGKLLTGSYGTLGLITECAFRLHPLPSARAWVTRPVDGPADTGRLAAAIRGAQVVPSAAEIDTAAGTYAVLLEGVPAGVARRAETVAGILGGATVSDTAPDWWGRYPWEPGGIGLKLTAALSAVPALLAAASGYPVRGSVGAGVLYAAVPPDAVGKLRQAATEAGGHAVVLAAPPGTDVDRWGPVEGLDLMRRVKAQFDPAGRFAPGRFVGGI
jgi:glycolate dehydrogenase FAD-binding subunit